MLIQMRPQCGDPTLDRAHHLLWRSFLDQPSHLGALGDSGLLVRWHLQTCPPGDGSQLERLCHSASDSLDSRQHTGVLSVLNVLPVN